MIEENEYWFDPKANIPVQVMNRKDVHLPDQYTPIEIINQMLGLRILDRSGRLWQGGYMMRELLEGDVPLSGSVRPEDGNELLFLITCQGDYEPDINYPTPYTAPVVFEPPYHIIVTRENYVLMNSGIYCFPFDQTLPKELIRSFVKGLLEYLQTLSTEGIIQQVEKWINNSLPLKVIDRTRPQPITYTYIDTEKDYPEYLEPIEMLMYSLPSDAGRLFQHFPEEDKNEMLHPRWGNTYMQPELGKELDRLFSVMKYSTPLISSMYHPHKLVRGIDSQTVEMTVFYPGAN